ncbi:retrotransposon protein, putative, ty1-copia subclass [Tanacetum coccineum]
MQLTLVAYLLPYLFTHWLDLRQLRIVLSTEDKLDYLEQPIPPAPVPAQAGQQVAPEALVAHNAWVKGSKEIDRIMLMTMEPDIQQNLENLSAYDMLQELKTLFAQQAKQELLQTVRDFHSCKQEEGQFVSSYILKIKSYIDNLERLGHPVSLNLGVSLILISLREEFNSFVQNYNMHNIRNTVNELHAMLKLYEQTLTKKDHALHAIRAGKVQKKNNKQRNAWWLARGLNIREREKGSFLCSPNTTDPPSTNEGNPAKDSLYLLCGDIRSTRTRHTPDRMCLYNDAEEHELGDLGEPTNNKAELLDPESDKWLNAMNWLFKKKTGMDEAVHTFKARLVAKGFTQTYMVDYEETFSPIADIRAIRILIAIAAYYDYKIWQMDVKTAFLNRHLLEEVYMEQPEGFINPKYLNRKVGFTQNHDEPCVYLKASGSNVTFLILYVDDILIMENHILMLQDVKSYLGRCFAMKDLGEAAYIFGIKIYRDRSWRLIGLRQSAYIEKILKRFNMENSKRGSILMQEKQRLSDLHWTTVKNILKYLRNTKDMFLVYEDGIKRELRVSCYTDAGYLTDVDDLKSQTGYVFVLNGGAIDWKSTKKFISGLGVVPTIEKPINMYCDNTRAITIANESRITKGARHFHAKVYYLREVIKYGDIKLEKVHTDDNLADPFTKLLAFLKHSEHTRNIRMLPASSLM